MVEWTLLFSLRFFRCSTGVLLASFLGLGALGAQPKAFASLQPDRIETGDTAGLIILVSGLNSEPKDLDFSAWSSVLPSSNIIGRSAWRRSGVQWTRRYTLIAFDSATLDLPPLAVRVSTGNPLETNALTLTVYPTRGGKEISDMAKIREIKREPESWLDYWPWMAGLALVLVLLVLWLRKNQRKPVPVVIQSQPVVPSISPTELALQQLSQLQQKQLWKHGQTKEHYAELSLIVREYLEKRYSIPALESTTYEIQKLLTQTDFPVAARVNLEALLEKTDQVKYAQSQPPESIHEAVLAKARELIAPSQAIQSANAPKQPPLPPPKNKPGKYEPL
jgi:hypothetical protein